MNQVQKLSNISVNDFPSEWYDIATEGHFWLEWRLAVFLQQLEDLGISKTTPLKGLDIGCGHGVVRRQIENRSAWIIDGTDLNEEILLQNNTKRGQTFLYDIHERKSELAEAYDYIILFDVLEHIEDTQRFLESSLYHLKVGGWLFINVPALSIFLGRFDQIVGHLRRYDQSMMRRELDSHHLQIKDMRYWGVSMLPYLLYRKLFIPYQASAREIIKKGFSLPKIWMNTWLLKIMRIETSSLKHPMLGASLLVAAVKLDE